MVVGMPCPGLFLIWRKAMDKFYSINARPGLNGNSPHAFMEAGEKIYVAAYQLEDIISKHLFEITHGRNYQHLEYSLAEKARKDDLDKVYELLDAIKNIKTFAVTTAAKATS